MKEKGAEERKQRESYSSSRRKPALRCAQLDRSQEKHQMSWRPQKHRQNVENWDKSQAKGSGSENQDLEMIFFFQEKKELPLFCLQFVPRRHFHQGEALIQDSACQRLGNYYIIVSSCYYLRANMWYFSSKNVTPLRAKRREQYQQSKAL